MLLIDGDIVAWRTGTKKFNCKPGDMRFYYHSCSLLIQKIVTTLDDPDMRIFISGKQIPHFRSLINLNYKANRKDVVKPHEVKELEWYLQDVLDAELVHGYEADDALGWNQSESTVICTIDKDLDMIPGLHYNFVRGNVYNVNQLAALRFFYKQMLIGDTSDYIFGIKGIGPVKAEKLLKDTKTEQEMFDIVYKLYNDPKRFVMNACCLWILRNKGELWVNRQNLILPEQCKQEVDLMLEFTMSLNLDI